ncbi:MAG TPA: AAA family ATPase [Polyangium sp.]|nr:AAA family ATPase [Polyangium sp.]
MAKLRQLQLIAIAGPSGAGKSSFVRAGVFPALKRASRELETFVVHPGKQPLAALADVLAFLVDTAGDVEESVRGAITEILRTQPRYLGAKLRRRCRKRGNDHRILLFVDPWEVHFISSLHGQTCASVAARARRAMKIPYSNCDFASLRREGYFYVDKTHFIPRLESVDAKYVIFLRPRRFGKSTLISTLRNYYDIALADQFDALFGGLWIHEHPTPEKNKYLVLALDFSPVDTEGAHEDIRASFATQVKAAVQIFVARYVTLIPSLSELHDVLRSDNEDTGAIITMLFTRVANAGHQVYLLIDEYDYFGNRLLSDGNLDTYHGIVRSGGFVRSFYASLKAATSTSTLARLFVTGVSPIMLDDLSSGFNIITHISQNEDFDGLTGFSRADVERGLDLTLQYLSSRVEDSRLLDRQTLLATLEEHYNGYRFAKRASEKMYNSTLVLYFLRQLKQRGIYPDQMLDLNVRTDYGRLYAIANAATGLANGTRELLEEVLSNGSISSRLVEQFGTRAPMAKAQIASLFYYMGMLTFGPDAADESIPTLVIPNRVMRELQWEYMSMALADNDHICIDVSVVETSLMAMANQGNIQPLLDVFHKQVIGRLSNKDLMKFDEKNMKLMLMAYLCQTQVFNVVSEIEMAQGHCDLLLGLRGFSSANKYAWIIEAKYVKTKASSAAIEKAVADGVTQIEKYVADKALVDMLTRGKELKTGVLVFVGLKDVFFRPWPAPAKEEKTAAKKAANKRGTVTTPERRVERPRLGKKK